MLKIKARIKLLCVGILLSFALSAAISQPNPQYQGVNNILPTPLTRFPDRLQLTYMLEQGVTDRAVEIGCQNGSSAPVWVPLADGLGTNCNRELNQNLRVFVRTGLCNVANTIELKPRHVESAWVKDGISEGSIIFQLREQSLNWHNVFKNGRPFSVLKSC
jgi:hypothetical protein